MHPPTPCGGLPTPALTCAHWNVHLRDKEEGGGQATTTTDPDFWWALKKIVALNGSAPKALQKIVPQPKGQEKNFPQSLGGGGVGGGGGKGVVRGPTLPSPCAEVLRQALAMEHQSGPTACPWAVGGPYQPSGMDLDRTRYTHSVGCCWEQVSVMWICQRQHNFPTRPVPRSGLTTVPWVIMSGSMVMRSYESAPAHPHNKPIPCSCSPENGPGFYSVAQRAPGSRSIVFGTQPPNQWRGPTPEYVTTAPISRPVLDKFRRKFLKPSRN